MRKILIVEDEDRLRELVFLYFKKEGFSVIEASNGREALDKIEANKLDLIILDVMIPEIDGFSLCKKIRKNSDVPIIIITAKTEEEDKILGFELGADEYVTKPFSPKVLVARAKNLLKRAEGSVRGNVSKYEYENLVIDYASYEVKVNGKMISLSPKEYDLLLLLVKNKNKVLTREIILDSIWGYDYFGDLRTVDTHIKKLRNKLGESAKYIKTIIRAGYKFEVK
ncbi:response regulator transcription factor [Helicovermis profundi]|uniref:Stage 0 sporulation protein A homolog n=1 Tax=Helicovermis profundi TaxID=3065157 RepID=A0AAU9EYB9_9FIRM|nr:response regulator transcription factor [Clostridia bacterium S502]